VRGRKRDVLLYRFPGGASILKGHDPTRGGVDVQLHRADGTVEWLTPRPQLILRLDGQDLMTIEYIDPQINMQVTRTRDSV